jgi:hypothetical protein
VKSLKRALSRETPCCTMAVLWRCMLHICAFHNRILVHKIVWATLDAAILVELHSRSPTPPPPLLVDDERHAINCKVKVNSSLEKSLRSSTYSLAIACLTPS